LVLAAFLCATQGCDASVLLNENTTKNVLPEKLAEPNHSLEGFMAINEIKRQVERKCPGIVSCSDRAGPVRQRPRVRGAY